MKKTVKLLKIAPKLEVEGIVKLTQEIITKEVDFAEEDNKMLDFFYENIGCDCIDVVAFGYYDNPSHYSVTVDDEGLLKSGNVVIQYTLPIDNEPIVKELAGTILIGKVAEIEGREFDGFFEVGLSDTDIEYLTKNLKFDLKGVTR